MLIILVYNVHPVMNSIHRTMNSIHPVMTNEMLIYTKNLPLNYTEGCFTCILF